MSSKGAWARTKYSATSFTLPHLGGKSTKARTRQRSARGTLPEFAQFELVIPWWANPLWALVLLTGTMALISVTLPEEAYATWEVRKFISGDLAVVLLLLFLCLAVGVLFASGISPRARRVDIYLTHDRLRMLNRAYGLLIALALVGYLVWAASAVAQGVGVSNLLAVLGRSQGAIGELKANARPIGGVTTLTQFGPIAIALNIILWRAGIRHLPGFVFLIVAATARVFFYAERLALIELIIPAALVAAMIVSSQPRWRRRVALAPVFGVPVVWGIFAMSEYFRSWVYYQENTNVPFEEWVSLRLIGYYVTSFNNSALVAQGYESYSALPWFSLQWFWNFPGVESLFQHPGIAGYPADAWWTQTLINNANYNFTNTGSFLTTYAEYGLAGAMLIWLLTGLALGGLFNALSRGNIPALLLYTALFVGVLELPRMIYWTLGRSTPVIIAALVMFYFWAKLPKPGATLSAFRTARPRGHSAF